MATGIAASMASISGTMTSREIAELTGKDHRNVLADIRKMLQELGLSIADFSAVYKDQQFIDRPCFALPKRETMILTSGYSIKQRAAIIDRWQALEQQTMPALPKTFAEALRVAADLAEHKAHVEAQLALAAPKVAALERITASDGELCLQAAGKVLQQPPNKFIQWMRSSRWIYKRPGGTTQCFVTPKGLVRLAKILGVSLDGDLFAGT